MYSYVNVMNVHCTFSFLRTFKEGLIKKRLHFKPLISSFSLIFIFLLNISVSCMPPHVYGHILFGNPNDNGI